MSMQKLIGTAALAGALLAASLGARAAEAVDELVVYGAAPAPAVVGRGQQVYRESAVEYIRSFKQELRAAIAADLKRELAPKVEVAMVAVPTRG